MLLSKGLVLHVVLCWLMPVPNWPPIWPKNQDSKRRHFHVPLPILINTKFATKTERIFATLFFINAAWWRTSLTLMHGKNFLAPAPPGVSYQGYPIFWPSYIAETCFPSTGHIVFSKKKLLYVLLRISTASWWYTKFFFKSFKISSFFAEKLAISYPTLKNSITFSYHWNFELRPLKHL